MRRELPCWVVPTYATLFGALLGVLAGYLAFRWFVFEEVVCLRPLTDTHRPACPEPREPLATTLVGGAAGAGVGLLLAVLYDRWRRG